MLLQDAIQKELRLSKKQIDRIQAISGEVDAKNAPKQQEIQQIQKQIEELQQRIAKLQQNIGDHQTGIEKERSQSLGKAAPETLSARSVQRLREIQRQGRGLDKMLEDPKVQRLLKLDDEQLKKIETILKTEHRRALAFFHYNQAYSDRFQTWAWESQQQPRFDSQFGQALIAPSNDFSTWAAYTSNTGLNEQTLRELFEVLTPAQRRTVLNWIGEPYYQSWRVLKDKK